MALDLSALEDKPEVKPQHVAHTGKPLDIPLADIEEDPDQPRSEFSEESMKQMTESIKKKGVKTPVSVRPHPHQPGKWILNYGARRYRGSVAAGKDTIPAFVDALHDDYDQVIENIQRENLTPMELALFLKKMIDKGEKQVVIAKELSKTKSYIAEHLALIDPPACVEEIYNAGKCMSARTLYDLRTLHDKYPEQVDKWCADGAEITRRSVSELAAELSGKKKPISPISPQTGEDGGKSEEVLLTGVNAEKVRHDELSSSGGAEPSGGSTIKGDGDAKAAKSKKVETDNDDDQGGNDHGELTSWPKGRAISDPQRMNKPLLLVEYDGRSAAVILNKRPSTPGLLHIRYEDGGGDAEVDAGQCKINLLTDTDK
jgi:ParB family chromosome partitioning protein